MLLDNITAQATKSADATHLLNQNFIKVLRSPSPRGKPETRQHSQPLRNSSQVLSRLSSQQTSDIIKMPTLQPLYGSSPFGSKNFVSGKCEDQKSTTPYRTDPEPPIAISCSPASSPAAGLITGTFHPENDAQGPLIKTDTILTYSSSKPASYPQKTQSSVNLEAQEVNLSSESILLAEQSHQIPNLVVCSDKKEDVQRDAEEQFDVQADAADAYAKCSSISNPPAPLGTSSTALITPADTPAAPAIIPRHQEVSRELSMTPMMRYENGMHCFCLSLCSFLRGQN